MLSAPRGRAGSLLLSFTLSFFLSGTPTAPAAGLPDISSSSGYWHTDGLRLLDGQNRPVRIAGVTWMAWNPTTGPRRLGFQPYTVILDEVKALGYNTIRIPFSNQLVESNPVVTRGVAANPQFRGLPALSVLDALVAYAGQIGLKILLVDQRSQASIPTTVNILNEPLWYTPHYPEAAWLDDWRMLARRYAGNDAVIGFDLRNEPHTNGPGPWTIKAYLHQGATWGPYAGVDNPATDWRLAAERAGNAILAINPHLLIVVEGLQLYPEAGRPNGVLASWWGGNVQPVRRYPVRLVVPHQLVYSIHEWGPRKAQMPWFSPMTAASLARARYQTWSFLLHRPLAPYAAPVLLGEFGTCTSLPTCLDQSQPNNQASWLQGTCSII